MATDIQKMDGIFAEIIDSMIDSLGDGDYNLAMTEIKRYVAEFPRETDYNIVQYGNLLVYYGQVRDFYSMYSSIDLSVFSDMALWEMYKQEVGMVANYLLARESE